MCPPDHPPHPTRPAADRIPRPPPAVTRFAPSPTGRLHLGHALAACVAHDRARATGGRFLLRIEDLDASRSRPEYAQAILDDLRWLELPWDGSVMRQSERLPAYAAALDRLDAAGLLYPCFCTRKAIRREVESMGLAPHPDGSPKYPGTCRRLHPAEAAQRVADGEPHALRLDAGEAFRRVGTLAWTDLRRGKRIVHPDEVDDAVLARKDTGVAYHLAVVVDDAEQAITLVTRGEDLLAATPIHRVLIALLDLPLPRWEHHPLVLDDEGRRLAKRDGAEGLHHLRESGLTPAEVRARIDRWLP